MKKVRQIAAILGIILLVGMYVFTLIAAFTDNPETMHILGLYRKKLLPEAEGGQL